jgi:hypothetical protein
MKIVRQVRGKRFRFGGEEHEGWLPRNATLPLPTPVEDAVLDIFIGEEAGGFILYYESRETNHCGDTWHQTLSEAEDQARGQFGVELSEWESVG